MAARRPIVLISGFLYELPNSDGVTGAVQPNVGAQNITSMQEGELAVDSTTNPVSLVIRLGNLVWRFPAGSTSSYAGKMEFSISRNSHWIGVLL